jgi:2-C-methyl-D-erythritol 4-phosphate cytidylyltransferase
LSADATSQAPALHVLIPAGGSGSRAGTAQPKQYEVLAGRPLIHHTLAAFAAVPRIVRVLVVVATEDDRLSPGEGFEVARCGGATRAESVANGLRELVRLGASDEDWVLVHDAARCLIGRDDIERLVAACEHDEVGGLLALPLADTLKQEEGGRSTATLQRQAKWLAQTPQMFRLGVLRRALVQAGAQVTDEASALETIGLRPLLVRGSSLNIKVTWPEDFALAEAILRSRKP